MLVSIVCVGLAAAGQEGRSAEELFAAWQGLGEEARVEVVEWFHAECDRSTSFRSQLEQFVLRELEDPFSRPRDAGVPTFDPAVHAPAQVIPRKFIDVDRGSFAKEFERLKAGLVEAEYVPAFRYDWARGEVVALGPAWGDPERIARNASRGFTPYTDLVEALVAETLDNAPMVKHAEAFGHAYSDRDGNAYREVTLYDAWSSGAALEMPDVEVLGIVHLIENDWKTYVAPVPPSQHSRLYKKIADHFRDYSRYRGLREALARTYLSAEPDVPPTYNSAIERLHGYWEEHGSRPSALAAELPSSRSWKDWLEKKGASVDRDPDLRARRAGRIQALQESNAWARRTFEGILKEYGAFDPKPPAPETPAPKPPKPPKPPKEGGGG